MYGKSPITKALVGKQNNLPAELKAKIMAAPESPAKMYGKKSPAKKYKSDAQRKAVHASKADKGSPAKKYGKSPMREDKPTSYMDAYRNDPSIQLDTDYDEKVESYKKYNRETYGTTEPTRDAKKAGLTKKELAANFKNKSKKVETKTYTPTPKGTPKTEAISKNTEKNKQRTTMSGKKTLGDTKLGNVKVGKNGKRLADTKVGKAFSKGRAKGVAARQARAERMAAAKAERIAKRKARKNKK